MWSPLLTLTLLLGLTHGYKIDANTGEKVCTLEKSSTNGEDCFYEPECGDVCKDVLVEVTMSMYLLRLNNLSFLCRSADQ